ncbi:MAG: ABC transporter permease, partial [Phycisphaerales bacterium]|nr:ABC transporter permease [Phycisphaerales bacterium]
RLAVVDLDGTEASASFVHDLEAHQSIRLTPPPGDGPAPWTVEQAADAVRAGDVVAYVVVPDGFGDDRWGAFAPDGPALRVGIDPSRAVERGYLEGALMQVGGQRLERLFSDIMDDPSSAIPDVDRAVAGIASDDGMTDAQRLVFGGFLGALKVFLSGADFDAIDGGTPGGGGGFQPVRLEHVDVIETDDGPPSAFAFTMPQAIAWAVMSCTAGFAISIVSERTKGTLLRLHVAPHSRRTLLIGKGLACFTGCATVSILLMLLARLVLGVRIDHVPHLILSIGATSFCFTGLTMFVSTLGKTEQGVAGAGWALLMPLAMIGGAMIPLMVMPPWMRSISVVSPISWTITAFEGSIWRNFSAAEMLVPLTVLVAFGLTAMVAGALSLSRQRPV